MAKDLLGNNVKVGDAVIISPDIVPKLMICKVEALSEGGLATPTTIPGQLGIQAETIRLVFDYAVPFNPTMALNLVKVMNPVPKLGN